MKLILPVYYHTDETQAKEDAGLDCPLSEHVIRRVSIYNIDAICPTVEDDGTVNTRLWVSGTSFLIPMRPKAVEIAVDYAIKHGVRDEFATWKEKQKPENA